MYCSVEHRINTDKQLHNYSKSTLLIYYWHMLFTTVPFKHCLIKDECDIFLFKIRKMIIFNSEFMMQGDTTPLSKNNDIFLIVTQIEVLSVPLEIGIAIISFKYI